MVDAQPVDLTGGDQLPHQLVGGGEDRLVLHAQTREIADVEEPAIVDLVGRDPPIGRTIGLPLQQVVEAREALRIARLAPPRGHRRRESRGGGLPLRQLPEALLDGVRRGARRLDAIGLAPHAQDVGA